MVCPVHDGGLTSRPVSPVSAQHPHGRAPLCPGLAPGTNLPVTPSTLFTHTLPPETGSPVEPEHERFPGVSPTLWPVY